MKSVLWRVAKRLSYIQDVRCLKVKVLFPFKSVEKLRRQNIRTRPCRYVFIVTYLVQMTHNKVGAKELSRSTFNLNFFCGSIPCLERHSPCCLRRLRSSLTSFALVTSRWYFRVARCRLIFAEILAACHERDLYGMLTVRRDVCQASGGRGKLSMLTQFQRNK